jgi:hypothetical protein
MVREYGGCVRLGLGSDLKTCSGNFDLLSDLPIITLRSEQSCPPGLFIHGREKGAAIFLNWGHGGRVGFAFSPPILPEKDGAPYFVVS